MRILLTGGSACGKSTFGEALALRLPAPHYYIATMRPYGDGSAEKIARHQRLREGKGFVTIERDTDIGSIALPAHATALLECMCNLTANEMFDDNGRISDVYEKLLSDIERLSSQCGALIVVTNEVGGDGGGYDPATMRYVELLGRLNAALAERFDCVYELVCGIPVSIKGELL